MKLTVAASVSAFAAGVLADIFEPADFNVTQALRDNGVDVTAIPGLAGLAERSSAGACSIAVSLHDRPSCFGRITNPEPSAQL
jgi:hypothetical protein